MSHRDGSHAPDGARVMAHVLLTLPEDLPGDEAGDREAIRDWDTRRQRLSSLADFNAPQGPTPQIADDVDAPQPVKVQRVWGTTINLSVGASGMVMTHIGDGDFDRYRDAYILAMMQDVLLADVANAVFDASVRGSRGDDTLARLLKDGPQIKAHENMHWGGLITMDHSVQRFYELVVRQIRLDSRLEHTTRLLAEAHATVAREAENSVERLLTFVAILSFTVPLGLAVAQFQKPWPWDFLVLAGIAFGALISILLLRIATGHWWFRLARRASRGRGGRS